VQRDMDGREDTFGTSEPLSALCAHPIFCAVRLTPAKRETSAPPKFYRVTTGDIIVAISISIKQISRNVSLQKPTMAPIPRLLECFLSTFVIIDDKM